MKVDLEIDPVGDGVVADESETRDLGELEEDDQAEELGENAGLREEIPDLLGGVLGGAVLFLSETDFEGGDEPAETRVPCPGYPDCCDCLTLLFVLIPRTTTGVGR